MKKIEIIWRELLFETIEKRRFTFTQKDLSTKFHISTSTVSQSLRDLRRMGAVKVSGRFFEVTDAEKILYHWASHRDLTKDPAYQTHVNLPVMEIEGLMPPETVFATYSAVRLRFGEPPADYDQVYVFSPDPRRVKERFPPNKTKQKPNLFVFTADPFLAGYGQTTTLAQTFVDLWNLSDWYAKAFCNRVKEEIDDLLS